MDPLVTGGSAQGIQRPLCEARHVDRSDFILHASADEEPHLVRAAACIHAVAVAVAETDRRRRGLHQHVIRRKTVEHAGALTSAHERAPLNSAARPVMSPRCILGPTLVASTHAGAPVIAPGNTTTPGALATKRSARFVIGVVSTFVLTSPKVVTAFPSSLRACCPVAVVTIS